MNVPFSIQIQDGPFANYPHFGAVAASGTRGGALTPGSTSYAYLARTARTQPDAPPENVGSSFHAMSGLRRKVESAIWFLDPGTKVLSAQWVNPDGNVISPAMFYHPGENALALVADSHEFQKEYKAAVPVSLTFVSY